MNQQNAYNVGKLGDQTLMPLAFGGHALFCQKCVTGDQTGEDFWERETGGIALPDSYIDTSLFVRVVGIGPRVGQPCTKAHKRKYDRARYFGNPYQMGQILLCPDTNLGIKRMSVACPGWCDYEFQIEESVPLVIYTPEDQAEPSEMVA